MSIHQQVTPMILTLTGWHAPPAPMRLHNGIPSPFRTRADDDHILNQGSTSHPTLSQNQDLIGELPSVEPLHLSSAGDALWAQSCTAPRNAHLGFRRRRTSSETHWTCVPMTSRHRRQQHTISC